MLRPDRILRRHALGGEAFLDGRTHGRDQGPILAHLLQEPHDVGRLQDLGQGRQGRCISGSADLGQIAVGPETRVPAQERFVRQPPQVLDEGELDHAGPSPQLADGERSHSLVGGHEAHELLSIQAAVGVADQLQGHGVDPCNAGHLPRGELRQVQVVLPRKVVPDTPDLGLDEVEVVEEPFRRRGDELAAVHVVGEDAIGRAQHAGVVFQAREERAGLAARIPGQREAGGEGPGPFLQSLDAEEFGGAEGLLGFRAAAAPEETAQRPQGVSQGDVPMVPRQASRRSVLIAWFRPSGCRGLPRLHPAHPSTLFLCLPVGFGVVPVESASS